MESYISFSIISVFFYTFMILTLLAGKRSRIINSFMCVLGGMLCWTLGSFLMRMEAGPSYILWYYVSLAGILFLPYFYYVFISEFMGVRMGRKSKIPLLYMGYSVRLSSVLLPSASCCVPSLSVSSALLSSPHNGGISNLLNIAFSASLFSLITLNSSIRFYLNHL